MAHANREDIHMETRMSQEINWAKCPIMKYPQQKEYIFFRTENDGWQRWTYLDKSTLISDLEEEKESDFGCGLFAAKDFVYGEYIGMFSGQNIAVEDLKQYDSSPWLVQLADNTVIDTESGSTGYVQFVNDARDTTSTNNVTMNERGYLVVVERIPAGCEILFSYGDEYWEKENRLSE
jgi:hypothetical protein